MGVRAGARVPGCEGARGVSSVRVLGVQGQVPGCEGARGVSSVRVLGVQG